jgi:1,4-dihydroxy-2-naphthoyl-CoA synthase
MGLVNKVVPIDKLEEEGVQWATKFYSIVQWQFVF